MAETKEKKAKQKDPASPDIQAVACAGALELTLARRAATGVVIAEERQQDGTIVLYTHENPGLAHLPAEKAEIKALMGKVKPKKYSK